MCRQEKGLKKGSDARLATGHLARVVCLALLLASMLLAGCAPAAALQTEQAPAAQPVAAGEPATLRVMTHDSFAISEEKLALFEQAYNVKVQFIKSGDTGAALNKAILSKGKPLADVFYGVDNTFLSRALQEEIFEAYASPRLAQVPDAFKLDPTNGALPVDYGDVCLNYDRAYFDAHGLQPPQSLQDLLKPEYKGLLVVQNPATSSPGLAFLLATIGNFGSQGYLDYWKQLVANDVLVVNDWESAYYTEFSGSSGKGPRPLVVSYNSSPVFEMLYAETKPAEPPTAAVTADLTCFRQIEFAGILKGTQQRALAEKWIDFMLETEFQQDLPAQMFVFPVNVHARLDPDFEKFLVVPAKTAVVSPEEIAANREQWLKDWTEAVLR